MFMRRRISSSARETLVLVASLRACAKRKDLYTGIRAHDLVLERGLLRQCSDALILMYAKCGKLDKANELLQLHKCRDVLAWTSLIGGYGQKGQGQDALDCFDHMQEEGIPPNAATFACALKACASIRAFDRGRQIHDEIARQGLLRNNLMLGNALVDMYAKCGALLRAHSVLKELCMRNVVSWNGLIGGYAQYSQGDQALDCFEQMQHEGISPDPVTFCCILKACASIAAVDKGERIHHEITKQGLLKKHAMLGAALVDMYAKCGALSKAQDVLEELPIQDVVCWCALIAGYAQQGQGKEALKCYARMECEGFAPNAVTYVCLLNACGSIGAIEKGGQIHDKIMRAGLLKYDVMLGNALLDMYAKCGELVKVEVLLHELPVRNAVSWNTLIGGYAEHGNGEEALKCYDRMLHEGHSPSTVTFMCVLKACGSIGAVDKGEQIHDEIARQGLLENDAALGNALVGMYAKCGAVEKAKQLLDELHIQNVVSWNGLIAGYVQQGQSEQALNCFEEMDHEGISPNVVTLLFALKACGNIGAVDKGARIHHAIARQGLLKDNIILGTALVDMYAKCGALVKAHQVLVESPVCGAVSWTAMLGGCQKLGDIDAGRWAFEHALHIDSDNAAAYIYPAG